MRTYAKIEELIGKTFTSISGAEPGSEKISIVCDDGSEYEFFHDWSCCESVMVESIDSDINHLIGSPILSAEESSNSKDNPPLDADSFTWTFYKLATNRGAVVIRWLGESNGYYGEEVELCRIK